ncbi:hypothetical protein AM493_14830 [Flavobacterium akiainvivens]|uniref:DoxX family protein n=1 Tax=Flavobacterium akiainvivens TaxID=1202724 RepID=A0A0M8MEG8_9FLAO|nr:DoxX family membrane protein [Flavobacterium akiainvivens]KOS07174.1 hypothetical protein AM493_14830 [Flavobacterium akiainvivens]SFQ72967.1 DoxX protein [Flavobacterium akiainvivens]
MNSKIFTAKPAWAEGIAIMRVFTGILIIKFGWEMFNQPLMADYARFLTEQHFPAPKLSAYLAKVAELAGVSF